MAIPRVLLVLLGALAPVGAQLPWTAYPIDALHGQFGHWTPLGVLSTGNADESRSQHLIPAAYLPPVAGSFLHTLQVSPHQVGSVPYESLRIVMSLTPAQTLGTDFDGNLLAPVLVYSATYVTIDWASNSEWYSIPLTGMFPYDGISNLVIDIQKVVDRPNHPNLPHVLHQMSNLPQRRDLPRPLFKDGVYHSGAATATTGLPYIGPPMLMRLLWVGPATLTIDGSRTAGGNWFRLGQTLGLHVHGPTDSVFLQVYDAALGRQPLAAPGVAGFYLLPPRFLILGAGSVGAGGVGDLLCTVPNLPALVDAHLYFQALLVAGVGASWTNVVDAILSP